ncbi:MAG: hypothetical protein EBV06_15845 [Planctomycetia bacterium]|nr:hypothetical protein [Planctomycetia bacterium]
MSDRKRLGWLGIGMLLGLVIALLWSINLPYARAGNDRHEDFILATGAVAVNPRAPTDGVWLLDYRGGKLLGTLIDRLNGKIAGWAEVDLVTEFGIPPRQNVHFMMTTGMIAQGQAALYIAETTTGKFAVYTMGQRPDGQAGIMIKRHDIVLFRQGKG